MEHVKSRGISLIPFHFIHVPQVRRQGSDGPFFLDLRNQFIVPALKVRTLKNDY